MIFTLEALNAEHGDSLLLHWDGADGHHLVLIDGGPPIVWGARLRDRLEKLRQQIVAESDPLPIEMMMVSHLDEDHIGGLVSMTRDLKNNEDDGKPLTLDIRDLWNNTFEDVLDDDGAPASLAEAAGVAESASTESIASNLPLDDAQAVVASINQGQTLRDNARALSIPINRMFRGKLIQRATAAAKPKDMGDGLTFDVLGPRKDRLDDLQKEWQKVLKKKKKKGGTASLAQVAEFIDKSVFNLSSIVGIARANKKSILFTGDARGDDIQEALEKAKLVKNGNVHFDVFKVPHHGSARNATEDYFRVVTADNYVISANGRDDNPDVEMLDMLVAARGKDKYTIHLTNPVKHALSRLKKLQTGKNFTLIVRDAKKPSLLVELGSKLPAKLRP